MARIPPDGCLVPTPPLAEILDRFFAQWKKDRPSTGGQFCGGSTDDVAPIRAAEWLASEAKMWSETDQRYYPVSESTIRNIVDRKYRMTELRVADALVTALGRPELFYDGTFRVFPNPAAPVAVRSLCCSGSTGPASSAPSAVCA